MQNHTGFYNATGGGGGANVWDAVAAIVGTGATLAISADQANKNRRAEQQLADQQLQAQKELAQQQLDADTSVKRTAAIAAAIAQQGLGSAQQPPPSKSNTGMIIAISVGVVVILAIGGAIIYSSRMRKTAPAA